MTTEELSTNQKSVKCWAIFWTLLYLALFPLLIYAALFSVMVFDNPHMTVPLGLSIIGVIFFIPLSIPVSIYLIWSNYWHSRYKRSLFFCALPILTLIIVLLLNALLQTLFLH